MIKQLLRRFTSNVSNSAPTTSDLISLYGRVLKEGDELDALTTVRRESTLPASKDRIREAILVRLRDPNGQSVVEQLRVAYVMLESFLPLEEYKIVAKFDAMVKVSALFMSVDPDFACYLASIVEDSRYESIQNQLTEAMKRRSCELDPYCS